MKLISLFGVLLATALLAPMPAAAPCTDDSLPDPWITMQAKIALVSGIGTDALAIHVDTIQGRVTLHGTVASTTRRDAAEAAVAALKGVTSVRNLVEVSAEPAPDSAATEARDDALATGVTEALGSGVAASGADIKLVSVEQGVVVLDGTVDRLSDVLRAMRLAAGVPGVRRVESRIRFDESRGLLDDEISRPVTAATASATTPRDAWLTTEVKLRLMAAENVPSLDVNVDTDDGVVTLFGQVDSEEARQAALAAAREVSGAHEVRDGLAVVTDAGHQIEAQKAPADEQGLAALVRKTLSEHRQQMSQETIDAIVIEVRNGIVRLQGDVPRSSDKLFVGTLTRSVDGVRAVMNELTVTSEDPPR